jgi:hypothetical protein
VIRSSLRCHCIGRSPLLLFRGISMAVPALAFVFMAGVQGQDKTKDLPGMIGPIDLMTGKGVEAVKGEWRYADVMTGVGDKKNEIEPKAHGKFDDSKWEVLKPETLGKARGPGKYSWCWYRTQITIPEKVGDKEFKGGPVWFQTTVDDYGEIWVDGQCDSAFGKSGRGCVSGFNTRNRVRLQKPNEEDKKKKRDAKPGDVFQVAVLGINGPIGIPPGNNIFLRSPTNLEFFAPDAPKGGADEPPTATGPEGKEVAKLDLMKAADVELVKGTWRRKLVELHTGEKKNDIEPKANTIKDEDWEKIEDPALLAKPWGPGKFSMGWYTLKVTIPEKVGEVSTAGTAAWFRTTVDDYAEIWINGGIDLSFGKSGRGAISGFNRQNEVKLTDSVKPGQTLQIAVLAINGPFGNPPGNFIFFRSPTQIRFFQK